MIDLTPIRPDDRVVALIIPDASIIAEIAAKLAQGLLVAFGPEDAVRSARRACSELDNVMFVPADGSGMLPWQDSFFTIALIPPNSEGNAEVQRVLVPNARIVTIDL